MSLSERGWWGAFTRGLEVRPMLALAPEYGVEPGALIAELVRLDTGGPAENAAWWPEVLRARKTQSIRSLAAQFGCEPRRIRRALARQGLRVGGVELGRNGVPALAEAAGRLGRESDASIARWASVSVEGVQGERRRLRIKAFKAGNIAFTPEEEAWIRGPDRSPRQRQRVDEGALEVVRRPSRGREAAPLGDASGVGAARARIARVERREVSTDSPTLPPAWSRTPPERTADGAPKLGPAFFWEERGKDIEKLLQTPARPRDGRQRIVREDSREPVPVGSPVQVEPVRIGSPLRVEPVRVEDPRPTPAPARWPQAVREPVQLGRVEPSRVPMPMPMYAVAVWTVELGDGEPPMMLEPMDVVEAARAAVARVPPALHHRIALVRERATTVSLALPEPASVAFPPPEAQRTKRA